MTARWVGAANGQVDTYEGGPRQLLRELGLIVDIKGVLGYAAVEDAAVAAYWTNRTVHGPRCGTALGWFDHHLVGGTACQPCADAEQAAVWLRRGAAS